MLLEWTESHRGDDRKVQQWGKVYYDNLTMDSAENNYTLLSVGHCHGDYGMIIIFLISKLYIGTIIIARN